MEGEKRLAPAEARRSMDGSTSRNASVTRSSSGVRTILSKRADALGAVIDEAIMKCGGGLLLPFRVLGRGPIMAPSPPLELMLCVNRPVPWALVVTKTGRAIEEREGSRSVKFDQVALVLRMEMSASCPVWRFSNSRMQLDVAFFSLARNTESVAKIDLVPAEEPADIDLVKLG